MTKLCIDLCSGLGGFSQAFVDAGWEVVRVDIEEKFKPTICTDITKLSVPEIKVSLLKELISYEDVIVLASPPCQSNSIANGRHWLKNAGQYLRVAAACLDIIRDLTAEREIYFALENPKGRLRWFLGKPKITIALKNFGYPTMKPTDIWANFSLPLVEVIYPKDGVRHNFPFRTKKGEPKTHQWSDALTPADRSKMPYGLSQAILEAVDPDFKLAGESSSKAQSPTAPPHPLQRGSEN